MNKIAKARKTMRDAFEEDEAFKQTYVANISMLLYDKYGIKVVADDVKQTAKDILKLIFY